ncbi:MAG: PQQ-dependent sugar dehydrogenase [Rhodothermales bacterium]|nr:PQQ-dependent sugar dehydrogenase [Rhodothermales bacterium]
MKSLLLILVLAGCATPQGLEPVAPPETNRFTREVLVEDVDEPMQMDFDGENRVYWVERKGGVRRYDGAVSTLGVIPTDHTGEGGMLGIQLAPDVASSRQLYLYFGAPGEGAMHLSRFTLGADDTIDRASEVVLLRVPYERGSHMGGGMTWDAAGNLYLSTGDNSDATQYTPIHWTAEGGAGQDAQRSAANTNDLRGKILRIHPEVKLVMDIAAPAVPGSCEAVRQAGRKDVKVIGLSLPNLCKPCVHDGTVQAVVLWNTADLGYLVVETAAQLIRGEFPAGATKFQSTRMGSLDVNGSEVVLGKPMIFNKENIDKFNF